MDESVNEYGPKGTYSSSYIRAMRAREQEIESTSHLTIIHWLCAVGLVFVIFIVCFAAWAVTHG